MSCLQFFPVRLPNGSTATNYLGLAGEGLWTTSSVGSSEITITRWAGDWRNFTFEHLTAPGSGKSFTYTLVKNGVDTAVVITVADLATLGRSTSSVTAVSGDKFYWRRTSSGSPTLSNVRYCSEFAHSAANLNGHHGYFGANTGSGLSAPLFAPSVWTSAVVANNTAPVAAPGDLTELYYKLTAAPGSGKNFVFVLTINGVQQDGSGGTTDTRVTIADAATEGTWSGSIALSAGDLCTLSYTPSGTPTSTSVMVSVTFEPTVDGESNACGRAGTNMGTSGTWYVIPAQNATTGHTATEADNTVPGSVSDYLLRDFRVSISSTIATGPVTFTTRVNASAPGGTPAVTLTSGQSSGTDATGEVTIEDGDVWTLEYVATGSPGVARILSMGWVLYALASPTPIIGSSILGDAGHIEGLSRVHLLNLDGTMRTLTDLALQGSACIGGVLTMYEQTSPPTAVAGTVRIWLEDNGAGKLRLMSLFPSGAAQQLSIEP
jgi:hypothetical protein